jgi:hypothetical protein
MKNRNERIEIMKSKQENTQEEILQRISKQLEEIIHLLKVQKQEKTAWGKMGRPTKEHIVRNYRKKKPQKRKMQCVRDTGVSIKTVSKYWDMT